MLSAYFNLNKEDFLRVLKSCSIVSFRYNIIGGLNPNELENTYNTMALNILKNKKFAKDDLKDVYPNDDNFETDFTIATFKNTGRNNKIVKYILSKIEKQEFHTSLEFDTDFYSIEQIIPISVNDWDNLREDEIERSLYRLGISHC